MGPPTVTQRVELIEEKLQDVDRAVKELVSKAVDKAMEAMRHTLTEVLMEGQTLTTKKMVAEFEALSGRLEGRVNRSREYHETLINTIRSDQLKFQAEMKSTLTGLQVGHGSMHDKTEPSVNRGELFNSSPLTNLGLNEKWNGDSFVGGSGHAPAFGQSNWRYRKLDMPIFDGTDPDGWILRVERYFGFYRLTEEEMLEAVVVAMEGDALRWFQWENKRRPVRRWVDLKTFILRQFRSVGGGSLYEQWLSTIQTSTVSEYRRRFIETAGPLERVSEDMLLGHFINGLKEEIRAELRLMNPICLEQAMEQALRVEEKQNVTSSRRTSINTTKYSTYSSYSKGANSVGPYSLTPPTSPPVSRMWGSRTAESQASVLSPARSGFGQQHNGDVKRLTESELQEKKGKRTLLSV